jgi:hypothetical protein
MLALLLVVSAFSMATRVSIWPPSGQHRPYPVELRRELQEVRRAFDGVCLQGIQHTSGIAR